MLFRAAPEEQSCDGCKKQRRKGLKLSCGSLLAIGIFSSLVRNRMRNGSSVQNLLETVDTRVLGLAGKDAGNEVTKKKQLYGLYAAMAEFYTP